MYRSGGLPGSEPVVTSSCTVTTAISGANLNMGPSVEHNPDVRGPADTGSAWLTAAYVQALVTASTVLPCVAMGPRAIQQRLNPNIRWMADRNLMATSAPDRSPRPPHGVDDVGILEHRGNRTVRR